MTITGLAASALLYGVQSSLQQTTSAVEETIAAGLAEQMMDEVLGTQQTEEMIGMGIVPGYLIGKIPFRGMFVGSREYYNRIDDYLLYFDQPPHDEYGVRLGRGDGRGGERHKSFWVPPSYLANWARIVDVYYVSEDDLETRLPLGATSQCRAIEVTVFRYDAGRGGRALSELTRVVSYVQPE